MEWYIVLAILVISLSLFLLIGLPVAFSLGFSELLECPGLLARHHRSLRCGPLPGMVTWEIIPWCVCPCFILMAQLVMHSPHGNRYL